MSSSLSLHEVEKMIRYLESAIEKDIVSRELLTKLQHRLESIDKRLNKSPNKSEQKHQLFELQALIYAAEGKTQESDKYVVEAITLAGGVNGLSSRLIKAYITRAQRTDETQAVTKQPWYRKPLSLAVSFIGIVVVYGLINLVLVGGQKAIHHGDQVKLDNLKTELDDGKAQLDALDSIISEQENYLTTTGDRMDYYESAGLTNAYNSLVDPYNETYSSYIANIDDYNSRLPSYNSKVDEANRLAESIGSTYYVVPVPSASRNH